MTDLAARLRDVLSDEMLSRIYQRHEMAVDSDAWHYGIRESLIDALLPFLSSLLEVREREIREALTLYCCHVTGMHSPTHTAEYVCELQKREAFDRAFALLHGREAIPSDVVRDPDCLKWERRNCPARLASSSSPAAPQEQK